jgi:hypothetical protein
MDSTVFIGEKATRGGGGIPTPEVEMHNHVSHQRVRKQYKRPPLLLPLPSSFWLHGDVIARKAPSLDKNELP